MKVFEKVYDFVIYVFAVLMVVVGIVGMFAAFVVPIVFLINRFPTIAVRHIVFAFLIWFLIELVACSLFLLGYIFLACIREEWNDSNKVGE